MRFLLGFETPLYHASVIRETTALGEGNRDEPTKKTDNGVFHLILILRLLDISMFYENRGHERNLVKIPKKLEGPISLTASYVKLIIAMCLIGSLSFTTNSTIYRNCW